MNLEEAKESIDKYAKHGVLPGDFLQAVLENNLMDALGRADETSRENLYEICSYIYNNHYIPTVAWGSRENVREWIARHEKKRVAESEPEGAKLKAEKTK